jgi:hypothetical protein
MAGLDKLIFEVDIQTSGSKRAISALEDVEKAYENAEKGSMEYEQALKDLQTAQIKTGKSSKVLARDIDKLETKQQNLIDVQNRLIKSGKTSGEAFKNNAKKLKIAQHDLERLRGESGKAQLSFGKMSKSTDGASASMAGLKKAGGGAIAVIVAIGTALLKAYEYISPIEQRFGKLSKTIQRFSGETGKALDDSTAKIASLGATFELTDEEIIQSAQSLQKNSESVETFAEALELIEKGLLAGANSNDDFLDSLKEYPSKLKDAGIEGENLIKILTVGAKGGFFSDKLIDSLGEAQLSLREFDKAQKDALKPLGDTFVKNLEKDIEAGLKDVPTLLMDIQKQAELAGLSTAEYQKLTSDILKGAGEDAGGLKNVTNALTEAYALNLDELDALGEAQKKQLGIQEKLNKQQVRLAENFKGLSAAVSNFSTELETELLQALNGIIEMFDSVDDQVNKFKSNLKSEEIVLNVGSGITEDFTYGLESANRELEIAKKNLKALKAQGEGGVFSDLDEDIENAELQLKKAEATLESTTKATEQFKNESAKATEILAKLDKQLANEKDANKRAQTLAKIEAIQGRTIKTVADRQKANKALNSVLDKGNKVTKASEETIKARKKAIDDQNKALEKYQSLTENINDQLAQSRINVDLKLFDADTTEAQLSLDIARLTSTFDKEIKEFQKTAKEAGISTSEIETGIKARTEILLNEISILENEAQKSLSKRLNDSALEIAQTIDFLKNEIVDVEKITSDLSLELELDSDLETGLDPQAEIDKRKNKLDTFLDLEKSAAESQLSIINLLEAKSVKSKKEASDERYNILKSQLESELDLLKKYQASTTDINNKETEILRLNKEQEDQNSALRSEQIDKIISNADAGLSAFSDLASGIFEAQTTALDAQIEKQQNRVAEAQELAEKGNTEVLAREQKRLDELEEKKEKQAKRQLALDASLAAAKAVLAIVTAATAPPPLSFVTIASTIGAIAGAIPAVTGLFGGAFADGVIGFQGKGTGTSDSNPVLISHGESVITAKGTQNAPKALEMINKGLIKDSMMSGLTNPTMTMTTPPIFQNDFSQLSERIGTLETGLKNIETAIIEKEVSSHSTKIDRNGIASITKSVSKKQSTIKNRR